MGASGRAGGRGGQTSGTTADLLEIWKKAESWSCCFPAVAPLLQSGGKQPDCTASETCFFSLCFWLFSPLLGAGVGKFIVAPPPVLEENLLWCASPIFLLPFYLYDPPPHLPPDR